MSGPLASWLLAHSFIEAPAERFVLTALALRANHDGTGADLSVDQLAEQTGYNPSTITRILNALRRRGDVIRMKAGGGRGQISRHRIPVVLCADEDECRDCGMLKRMLNPDIRPVDNQQKKGSRSARVSSKGSPSVTKGSPSVQKGSPCATPYVDEDVSTLKVDTSVQGESAAALAPDGAAAEQGGKTTEPAASSNGHVSATATAELSAMKATWREQQRTETETWHQRMRDLLGEPATEPATAPTTIESEPNPPARDPAQPLDTVCASIPSASLSESASGPAREPADVLATAPADAAPPPRSNPAPATENATPRPAVQADTARELDPAQATRRRRHDQRGRKGRRGREPPRWHCPGPLLREVRAAPHPPEEAPCTTSTR